MEGLLNRAQVEKQRLEMIYLTEKGTLTQRTIRILSVDKDQFLAFCYVRKEVRSFKRSNVLSIQPFQARKRFKSWPMNSNKLSSH
ncbi:hypothetical protein [Thalassobacillus pellis]|uniref:hypothetical protein n=1 Tax=Thalassobacillus pellis TaxID=748008 RepID=UPI001961138C|nr:hypothetical protein [Thalassobacillus pellis]MBM7551881.1 putative DNA-binding transcriptional regulator YafY [Thalassobacillus pellis]